MAFECQGIGGVSPSKKNCIDNCWDEEPTSPNLKGHIPYTIRGSNPSKNHSNKALSPKRLYLFPSKKGTLSSNTVTTTTPICIGHRTITDLPLALLSEILQCLDAKELGIVSCVCSLLHGVASDHQNWKAFYLERWGPPPTPNCSSESWKEIFVEREFRTKSFLGRFSMDTLHGHTEAVRSVFILPSMKFIFTGGYDSMIRMWHMEDGLSLAVSRPLGCTIRAIFADLELLVVGGTDTFLHCWRAIEGHPNRFDIAGPGFRLGGHEGPVTCLDLDSTKIYSGSWDMTICVWDRARLKCLMTLRHGDWVWALVSRGSNIASSAGRDVYLWDTESGEPITTISNAHSGNAQSLALSQSGDLFFTGGEDGAIHLFDISARVVDELIKPLATWVPHTQPVHSLAFEFPWLVSSSSDGRIALTDVRKFLTSTAGKNSRARKAINGMEPPERMLHGYGCNLFSVAIGGQRIVCGGEEGVVRVWDFSEALEIERRIQALRSVRLKKRVRRRKTPVEMNGSSGGRTDRCSVAAKRNQLDGLSKQGVSGKVKA